MSITHDLLSWEYALIGYEEKIISDLAFNSDITPPTCPNVLHGFILKGDGFAHLPFLRTKSLLKKIIVSQQSLVYIRSNEKPWEK